MTRVGSHKVFLRGEREQYFEDILREWSLLVLRFWDQSGVTQPCP